MDVVFTQNGLMSEVMIGCRLHKLPPMLPTLAQVEKLLQWLLALALVPQVPQQCVCMCKLIGAANGRV